MGLEEDCKQFTRCGLGEGVKYPRGKIWWIDFGLAYGSTPRCFPAKGSQTAAPVGILICKPPCFFFRLFTP